MKQLSILLKPASSKCNLDCSYCFYKKVASQRNVFDYGMMKKETVIRLLDKLFAENENCCFNFVFQGGEPSLAGIDFYYFFIEEVNKRQGNNLVTYAFQTNASLIDEKWCQLFKKHDFLLGLSLDGFKENNNYYRSNYDDVIKTAVLLKKYGIAFNILTVLTPELIKKPLELFSFYQEKDFRYFQLIPCLDEISPEDFYHFYSVFFNRWFQEYLDGRYYSVSFIDNLIKVFKGELPGQCGSLGFCSFQYVVEANGNIYPCDFYCEDEYLLGNVHNDDFNEERLKNFLEEKRTLSLCHSCPYWGICGGQCKRQCSSFYNDNFCAIQQFIIDNEDKLHYLASL